MAVTWEPALPGPQFSTLHAQLQCAVTKLEDLKSVSKAFSYVGSYLRIRQDYWT